MEKDSTAVGSGFMKLNDSKTVPNAAVEGIYTIEDKLTNIGNGSAKTNHCLFHHKYKLMLLLITKYYSIYFEVTLSSNAGIVAFLESVSYVFFNELCLK